ncbi:hypothetical protein EJB05_26289, partial [Eragrostis curvula]
MADRLSALPDDLLRRVLYFAPAKEGASTAVLSRRWRSLWRTSGAVNNDWRSYHRAHGSDEATFRSLVKVFLPAVKAALDAAEGPLTRLTFHVEADDLVFNLVMLPGTFDRNLIDLALDHPAARHLEELRVAAVNNYRQEPAGNLQFYYWFHFASLPTETLRDLQLVNCSYLTPAPPGTIFPRLTALRLEGCNNVPIDCLQDTIEAAPQLVTLHLESSKITGKITVDGVQRRHHRLHCPAVTALVFEDCTWPCEEEEEAMLELDLPRGKPVARRGASKRRAATATVWVEEVTGGTYPKGSSIESDTMVVAVVMSIGRKVLAAMLIMGTAEVVVTVEGEVSAREVTAVGVEKAMVVVGTIVAGTTLAAAITMIATGERRKGEEAKDSGDTQMKDADADAANDTKDKELNDEEAKEKKVHEMVEEVLNRAMDMLFNEVADQVIAEDDQVLDNISHAQQVESDPALTSDKLVGGHTVTVTRADNVDVLFSSANITDMQQGDGVLADASSLVPVTVRTPDHASSIGMATPDMVGPVAATVGHASYLASVPPVATHAALMEMADLSVTAAVPTPGTAHTLEPEHASCDTALTLAETTHVAPMEVAATPITTAEMAVPRTADSSSQAMSGLGHIPDSDELHEAVAGFENDMGQLPGPEPDESHSVLVSGSPKKNAHASTNTLEGEKIDIMQLQSLPRRALQDVCKRNGIRANMKNKDMVAAILDLSQRTGGVAAQSSVGTQAQLDFDKCYYHFRHRKRQPISSGRDDDDKTYDDVVSDVPGLSKRSFNCLQSCLRRVSLQFRMDVPNCFRVQLTKFFAENSQVLGELYVDDGSHKRCEHMNWMNLSNSPDTAT